MPRLLAISSMETDRMPYCMNNSSAFRSIRSLGSILTQFGAKTKETFNVTKVSVINFPFFHRDYMAVGRFVFLLTLAYKSTSYEKLDQEAFAFGAVQMEKNHSVFITGSSHSCSHCRYDLFHLLDCIHG